jgi:hypothetical protein
MRALQYLLPRAASSREISEAFLVSRGDFAPRTHDIAILIERASLLDPEFSSLRTLAKSLNRFAVEIRYAASKGDADTHCSAAWSAMLQIAEMVRSKVDDATE